LKADGSQRLEMPYRGRVSALARSASRIFVECVAAVQNEGSLDRLAYVRPSNKRLFAIDGVVAGW